MVRVLLIVGLLTMALSTSTTGFAALGIAGAGLVVMAVLSGSFRMVASVFKVVLPLLIVFGLGAGIAGVAVPNFGQNVSEVLGATLNKQESSSYADRTSADVDSLKAALDTDGLGVGWGSNRSSSLIPGLLASLGLPGVCGLVWFATFLARRVRKAKRLLQPTVEQLMVIDGCCGGTIGFILASALSGPAITSVTFYFLIALLIACLARIELDSQEYEPFEAMEEEEAEAAV
jgi:hypothetical protein